MSNQAPITLNTVTYAPAGRDSQGILSWVDRSAGVQTGFSVLTQKASLASSKRRTNKFEYRVTLPVIETTSDACACSGDILRTNGASFSVWLADGAPASERTDIVTRLKDALTAFEADIENLDPAY